MLTKHQTWRFYGKKKRACNELLKKCSCTFSLESTVVHPQQNFIPDTFYVI